MKQPVTSLDEGQVADKLQGISKLIHQQDGHGIDTEKPDSQQAEQGACAKYRDDGDENA